MKKKIAGLLNRSMAEVERMYYSGMIEQSLFEAYSQVWSWSTFRFGGITGWKHDLFWKQYGKENYLRRINKTRKAFGLTPYSQ